MKTLTLYHNSRGSALLIAVILSGVILLIAASSASLITLQNRNAGRSTSYQMALSTAEAGAEVAMNELNKTSNQWAGWSGNHTAYSKTLEPLVDNLGREIGRYSVTVTNAGTATPSIDSVGIVPVGGSFNQVRRIRIQTSGVPGTTSPFGAWGLFSVGGIEVNSNVLMDSYSSDKGAYHTLLNRTSTAKVGASGKLPNSNTSVNLASNINLLGSVQAAFGITQSSNISILGLLLPNSVPTAPPTYPETEHAAAITSNNNAKAQILDKGKLVKTGISGDVILDSQKTLVLPAGTYFLNSLTLKSNVNLVTQGAVKVFLEKGSSTQNALLLESNVTVNANIAPGKTYADPKNLQFFIKSGLVDAKSNVDIYAGIYAPNSITTLESNVKYYGALVGQHLYLKSNVDIHADTTFASSGGSSSTGFMAVGWTEVKRSI